MSDSVREMIRDIANTGQEIYSIPCKVKSVNSADNVCDCSPIDDAAADLLEIKLIADNKTGFLIIPKVGSVVIVTMTSQATGYVAMFSEIEAIKLNGDENGGIVKIDDLASQWDANVNAIKAVFQTVFAAIDTSLTTAGGPAVAVSAYNPLSVNIKTLNKTTLENKTVKHGNG